MNNINKKIQLKNNCPELKKEIKFFDELIFDIEMRQVLFDEFEKYLVNKKIDNNFPDDNNFCRMISRGYLIQQLLDLAKFFDRDNRVYSFGFIVKHGANNFNKKHDKLFKLWKGYKLKNIRDKVFAHSQKDYTDFLLKKKYLDDFIKEIVVLFKDIINDLEKKYLISSIHFHENNDYMKEVSDDVEGFFNMLTKTKNN